MLRVRLTLAIPALALALGGCGGTTTTRRPSVAQYIRQINAIDAELTKPLAVVSSVGREFASRASHGSRLSVFLAQDRKLSGVLPEIRTRAHQLAALYPPTGAARLRRFVLELVDGEVALTNQLTELISFLPRFTLALRPLGPATLRLRSALAQTQALGVGTAGVKAALAVKVTALRSYQAELDAVASRLRRLMPPPVSRPTYRTQLQTLGRMSASAGKLAEGVGAGSPNVGALLLAFQRAAEGDSSVAAQRAEIAAIRAYDASIKRLSVLEEDVEGERAELASTLR